MKLKHEVFEISPHDEECFTNYNRKELKFKDLTITLAHDCDYTYEITFDIKFSEESIGLLDLISEDFYWRNYVPGQVGFCGEARCIEAFIYTKKSGKKRILFSAQSLSPMNKIEVDRIKEV